MSTNFFVNITSKWFIYSCLMVVFKVLNVHKKFGEKLLVLYDVF